MGLLWPLPGRFGGKKEETKSRLPQFGALFVESVVTAFVSTSTHQAGNVIRSHQRMELRLKDSDWLL